MTFPLDHRTGPRRGSPSLAAACHAPSLAGDCSAEAAFENGDVMTEMTPPIKVSGVPLDSRAVAPDQGRGRRHGRAPRVPDAATSRAARVVDRGERRSASFLRPCMIGLGFFVTKVLLSSEAVADADAWLPRWLEDQRTPFLNDASYVTSTIADRWVLIPLVGIVVLRSPCGSAGGWAASTFRRPSPRCSPTGS